MKTMKQIRQEYPISLARYAGGRDAWGTEFGATVFSKINLHLLGLREGTLVLLDYEGLERSDVSFQREAVVETIRKHRPRLLFLATNLSDEDLSENLELALERRGQWLLSRRLDQPAILGKKLTAEHLATLRKVWKAEEVTSSDLEDGETKLSTASSRLAWLWRAGLIERVEGTAPSGGREHRYFAIL